MKLDEYKNTWTEEMECSVLVDYLDDLVKKGKIRCYSHVANETYTPYKSVKARNKKLGVHAGVPDYLIVGLVDVVFLEMKRRKGGKISQAQQEWINALNEAGCFIYVANGVDEAKKHINNWLVAQDYILSERPFEN